MPQDIRISPDGSVFFVADMEADGVYIIDAATFKQTGFIPTGRGSHGLYPSRDGKKLYVTNRGTHMNENKARGMGSISVIDFATRKVEKNWPIPEAAARTWVTSAPMEVSLGLRQIRQGRLRHRHDQRRSEIIPVEPSLTGLPSGHSRAGIRWDTPAYSDRAEVPSQKLEFPLQCED
jgi:YVTN family beta-propeller protein